MDGSSARTLQRQLELSSSNRVHRRQVSWTPQVEEPFFTPLSSPQNDALKAPFEHSHRGNATPRPWQPKGHNPHLFPSAEFQYPGNESSFPHLHARHHSDQSYRARQLQQAFQPPALPQQPQQTQQPQQPQIQVPQPQIQPQIQQQQQPQPTQQHAIHPHHHQHQTHQPHQMQQPQQQQQPQQEYIRRKNYHQYENVSPRQPPSPYYSPYPQPQRSPKQPPPGQAQQPSPSQSHPSPKQLHVPQPFQPPQPFQQKQHKQPFQPQLQQQQVQLQPQQQVQQPQLQPQPQQPQQPQLLQQPQQQPLHISPQKHRPLHRTNTYTGPSLAGSAATSQNERKPVQALSSRRRCAKCQGDINGHFVRALNTCFHINCFACLDCGALCAAKFFPCENKPLCEHCYFKRQQLLCSRCGESLRGSYITALDKKYHVEHFTCSMCTTVFGPEDSYFEYSGAVYCRTHYGALFAFSCEGCQSPILKQYVETYRSSRQQQWHPECYMIFKFWNVKVADPQAAKVSALRQEIANAGDKNSPLDSRAAEVAKHEDAVDAKTTRIWTTLCAYEEACAANIASLVQCAAEGSMETAHGSCSRLVDLVRVLFIPLDVLLADDNAAAAGNEDFDMEKVRKECGKEAKTLCRKIISYMSLLSKTRKFDKDKNHLNGLESTFLGLTSATAHYLKVLIRLGLSTALKTNKLDVFLGSIISPKSDTQSIDASPFSTDRCSTCNRAVEDRCIRLAGTDKLWHYTPNCFRTSSGEALDKENAYIDHSGKLARVTSSDTASSKSAGSAKPATFIVVTRLQQYIALLRVALARLDLVLNTQKRKLANANSNANSNANANANPNSHSNAHSNSHSHSNSNPNSNPNSIPNTPTNPASPQVFSPASQFSHRANSKPPHTAKSQTQSPRVVPSPHAPPHAPSPHQASYTPSPHTGNPVISSAISPIDVPVMAANALERTSAVLHGKDGLTLDDIRRIVAAEQAKIPTAERAANPPIEVESGQPIPPSPVAEDALSFGMLTDDEFAWVQNIAIGMLEPLARKMKQSVSGLEVAQNSVKQTNLWNKMGKVFAKDSEGKVFGQPLYRLAAKYGVDSNLGCGDRFQASKYTLKIPSIIEDLVGAMRQKDMSVEGIFRKNGNIRRLREFVERVDKNPDDTNGLGDESPIQLAALLKKFLRDLPDPLFTGKLTNLWLAIPRLEGDEKYKCLQLLVCLLPRVNRNVLEVLSYFLNWVTGFAYVDEDVGSKMDISNIATVLAPSVILANEDAAPADDMSQNPHHEDGPYKSAIEVFRLVIENYTLVARVPPPIAQCLSRVKGPPRRLALKEIQHLTKKRLESV